MIALDTNILVRLLVQDDIHQFAAARGLLEQTFAAGETCFVSDPVICELVWVLRSRYRASRDEIHAALANLTGQAGFVFEDREVLTHALSTFKQNKAGFVDCLIGAKARAKQTVATYTFDQVLSQQEGFILLPA